MILIIAKVMIIKSMIIKMIMMFTMMITIWLNTECWNYSTYIRGDFLDSCHHFVTFFEIYSWTVQSRRFTMKKKFNSNIETGVFVWVRKIVINTGEWLWHSSEHCPVFWSCLQFVLFGHCWKFLWSIIMEYFCSKYLIGEGEISATLLLLWEALGPMSSKFDVMKFFQSIMTWYMNLLALCYPLQYAKRLVT